MITRILYLYICIHKRPLKDNTFLKICCKAEKLPGSRHLKNIFFLNLKGFPFSVCLFYMSFYYGNVINSHASGNDRLAAGTRQA